MKSKNFIAGILIIFIGVVALLSTLHVIEFHWSIFLRLWPIILIVFGITLFPLNDYLKGGLILATLGLGCLLYHVEVKNYDGNIITRFYHNIRSWSINDDDDEDIDDDEFAVDQHFSEPFTELEKASIDIDFGAGSLLLGTPCAELAKVDATSNFVKYSFRTEMSFDSAAIFVSGNGHTKKLGKRSENDLNVALCTLPVWSFSLDMGAADADLDFTPYKVSSIKIDGGACNLDLKLGDNGCNTKVEINSGASDIDILVPMGVDCQINIESAITGKDFPDFEKIERGLWQTPGFGQGEHQIVIDLNCAVSDISVKRY